MRAFIPIVLSAMAGALGAQLPVSHGPGLVVPVDFDGNGKDEFVVVDGGLVSHGYSGFFASSMIVPGPFTQLAGEALADQPVTVDQTLFVATFELDRTQLMIASYAIQANGWLVQRSLRTYPMFADPIATARITPFHRDIDGDGQRDLLVAWTETRNGSSSTYCLVHSPTVFTPSRTIQMPAFAPANPRVVSLGGATSPSFRTDEYVMGFSAADDDPYGGFGFVLLYDGVLQAAGVWFPLLPTLLLDEYPRVEDELVAYGCFSPFPEFGVPLVRTSTGRSARLGLDPTEPYIARRGEVLRSTLRGKQLPRCIADYDGDGIQEMAWIEYLANEPDPYLIVADPGPYRRQVHAIALESWGAGRLYVNHGASGDFDGDGDPDIVLSVAWNTSMPGSGLIYFRTERDGRRRTRLVRVQ